ncbi:MAG: hypothetical protein WC539_08870 [Nitrospirota bacterium]
MRQRASFFIYQSAENDPSTESEYEITGGYVYPLEGKSKKYVHDLKLYGGNAAVLADDFRRWMSDACRGKNLAYTLAFLTFFLSCCIFYLARQFSNHDQS